MYLTRVTKTRTDYPNWCELLCLNAPPTCYKNKDGLSKLWCELLCVNIPPTWVWCQSWKDEYHCGHSVLRVVQRSYRRTRTAPPKESIKKQAKRTTEMLKCLLGSDDGRKEGEGITGVYSKYCNGRIEHTRFTAHRSNLAHHLDICSIVRGWLQFSWGFSWKPKCVRTLEWMLSRANFRDWVIILLN